MLRVLKRDLGTLDSVLGSSLVKSLKKKKPKKKKAQKSVPSFSICNLEKIILPDSWGILRITSC